MKRIYPTQLKAGCHVRVVAPSNSLAFIDQGIRAIANKRFADLGLELSFGAHCEEKNKFNSSSVASRLQDLHDAFADPKVNAIISVIGGYNCNELLEFLDWELIKKNPKQLIGYSDTTALQNAIFARTGLVTYSGPAYSTFGQEKYFDYTLDYFKKCLIHSEPYDIQPAESWTDDAWYADQQNRHPIQNDGWWVLQSGVTEGTILGANLCTFNLLQGTPYFPLFEDTILFLEDDEDSKIANFNRDLQSLIHLPEFARVKGIVIGRFQKESKITKELMKEVVESKPKLKNLPILANVDFGHTSPIVTFPIGGTVSLKAKEGNAQIRILQH